jgi:hypothetical protein
MDAKEALKAACQTASAEAARIDANVRDKLLKRARKHGMTNESEVAESVEAWKRAAKNHPHLGHDRRKGH